MIESPDNFSVFYRIKLGKYPDHECSCGKCDYCKAEKVEMVAIDHLGKLFSKNEGSKWLIDHIVGFFLNPGTETDPTLNMALILKESFQNAVGKETFDRVMKAAEEFRKCETEEEVAEVAEKFPI